MKNERDYKKGALFSTFFMLDLSSDLEIAPCNIFN